jgi:long-chain acyl-CoA synthetase
MRDHLATLLDDFRSYSREIAVVRHQGNRRRVSTYGEIARLAGRFASLLVERGIGPGDRVLIWGENSAEWIAAFYGCLLRGVLAVPLDATGTDDFAKRVAADVAPKLAVGDALLLSRLPMGLPQLAFEDWLARLPAEEAGPVPGLSRETPLQILFTSGTTGDPKGIVLTHGNVLASVSPIADAAKPYLPGERLIHPLRIFNTLPLSHVFGQTMGLWVPPIFKAELHFDSRLVAPRIVETIRRERISVLAAVPRVIALLKAHLEATLPGLTDRVLGPKGARGFSRIRSAPMGWKSTAIAIVRTWWHFRDVHRLFGPKFWAIISGGGALQGALEQFWNAVGLVVVQGYGMTETTAIITLNHPFHVAEGTIGKPLAGREVKLGPDGEVLVRGASITSATWSGGALHPRQGEWLATGDLAVAQPTGELRFLGRKSEVIVTAAGLNLHPEDLEAAIEPDPGVLACAVVGVETAAGPEPCAVLSFRGTRAQAAEVIEHANTRLAEFQRILRWELWPEPDLPRTSTGKVRRKAVADWVAAKYKAAAKAIPPNGAGKNAIDDWLLTLIAQVTGETPQNTADEARVAEDLHLDSLARVQLAAAIEERLQMLPESGLLEEIITLGELRHLVETNSDPDAARQTDVAPIPETLTESVRTQEIHPAFIEPENQTEPSAAGTFIYPHWPWLLPVRWLRVAFFETVIRPLVWLLGKPKVVRPGRIDASEPMLVIANHVASIDAALMEYALPGAIRRRMAVAMAGEMLEDYRHFRNAQSARPEATFFLLGPLYYLLVTMFFNVFPLPRRRDFQRSFAHAGEALDHGFNVLIFPEGAVSEEGRLARFRPGIGLLVKQSGTAVLPMAMRGARELKASGRGWFRSGMIELAVGQPIQFGPLETEAAITARLHEEVEKLLEVQGSGVGDQGSESPR